ncbi:MAG: hypothetical protein DME28_07050 [Verrucomicrobia bacterium]|nr:MAG: hypothetical protein DME28_07050 [Verrucomicrobiota bacterium]
MVCDNEPLNRARGRIFFSVAVGPILKGLLATKIDADVGGGRRRSSSQSRLAGEGSDKYYNGKLALLNLLLIS